MAVFAKSTGHKDVKICTVHHINIINKYYSIKFSLHQKKFEGESSPNDSNNNKNNIKCSMVWASPQTKEGTGRSDPCAGRRGLALPLRRPARTCATPAPAGASLRHSCATRFDPHGASFVFLRLSCATFRAAQIE